LGESTTHHASWCPGQKSCHGEERTVSSRAFTRARSLATREMKQISISIRMQTTARQQGSERGRARFRPTWICTVIGRDWGQAQRACSKPVKAPVSIIVSSSDTRPIGSVSVSFVLHGASPDQSAFRTGACEVLTITPHSRTARDQSKAHEKQSGNAKRRGLCLYDTGTHQRDLSNVRDIDGDSVRRLS
jgi:hypothetical protein